MPAEAAEPLVRPGIQVDFRGSPPTVAFIQVPNGFFVTYAGIALFEMAGDEVIREIARQENRDPRIYAPGRHQYYFPDLNMTLWRSVVSEEEGEQGYLFDSVSLHTPGYYDAETMAYVRRTSGLPVVQDEIA
jgi:hypothetical protein